MIGNASVGKGELIIEPAVDGWISVNGRPYRGNFHFVAAGDGTSFESINYVHIEDYLKSVIPRELLRDWHVEAYMAQAIIARTYALYEKSSRPVSPRYDLYTDTRSQVYGGLKDETEKSRLAVDQTRGIVVVYGPAGHERIFKAYFSACCGGLSASAADVFGEAPSEPLSEQDNGTTCNMSSSFNWGPIVVPRPELTRRFRAWGFRESPGKQHCPDQDSLGRRAQQRWPPGALRSHGRDRPAIQPESRGTSLGGQLHRAGCNDTPQEQLLPADRAG